MIAYEWGSEVYTQLSTAAEALHLIADIIIHTPISPVSAIGGMPHCRDRKIDCQMITRQRLPFTALLHQSLAVG